MMADNFYSDEELIAYLDGEVEFVAADEIGLAIKNDPALAKRVSKLSIDKALLSEAFAAISPSRDTKPVFEKIPEQIPQSKPGFRWFGATAAAAALVLGLAIGSASKFDRQQGWMEYVAAYQALYTTRTLASVQVEEDVLRSDLARVASVIGKEIALEQLNVAPEVEFKRAQVLGFDGSPLIQLAFLSDTGTPFALCIIRNDENTRDAIDLATMEGMSSAAWSRDGYSYLLIGGHNHDLVSSLAEKFTAAGV